MAISIANVCKTTRGFAEWWIRVDVFPQRRPGPRSSHRSRWWRCPWEIAVHLHKPCTWGQAQGRSPTFFGKKIHPPTLNPENCWTVHESNSGRRWFWVSPRSLVAHLSLHSSCFRKVQSLGDRGQPKGDASTAGRNGTVIIKGNQQRQAGSDY